jgi:hypothetical protein
MDGNDGNDVFYKVFVYTWNYFVLEKSENSILLYRGGLNDLQTKTIQGDHVKKHRFARIIRCIHR